MKHSYRPECTCNRCSKERARRAGQGRNEDARQTIHRAIVAAGRRQTRRQPTERRPTPGSQEWAETRGDDIDSPSGDY